MACGQGSGRKQFFMACIALFTGASVLCGFAWDLQSLLIFRVLQGLGGGGMAPVSQSILADSFPPEKRGQAFALYGVAVVVAPVVGPTLGGWLSDNYSWHWCFLINAPVGIAAIALVQVLIRETAKERKERADLMRRGNRFDLVGFLLVATALGALEVVLDEGQRDDWFDSNFIRAFAVISALGFALLVPWALTRKNPIIDIRMLVSRQFGSCFLVMMATGAILIATTPVRAPIAPGVFRLHGHLGGPRPLARRPGHHVHDVRGRASLGGCPAEMADRGWGGDHRGRDVSFDQSLRRFEFRLLRVVARLYRDRAAADLHPDHQRLL